MRFSLEPGDEFEDDGTLVVEQRFAIVPEWVLDADISDAALRLYAVLLRYGQTSGQRMPGRQLLASRLRKRSKDSVDRAMKELVTPGAVLVQHRRQGQVNLTNRYVVRSTPLRRSVNPPVDAVDAVPTVAVPSAEPARDSHTDLLGGGRKSAATPGRTDAATLAANLRPNPEVLTQRKPPPPRPPRGNGGSSARAEAGELRRLLNVDDVVQVAADCRATRRRLGLATGLWTTPAVARVLHRSVVEHGWPADAALPAILALAADPETKGPGRLPCPGPWWEAAERGHSSADNNSSDEELANLEARLAEADGHRVRVQRLARGQLTAEGAVLTRLGVARRACALLDQPSGSGTC
jgi:hypothetical protein